MTVSTPIQLVGQNARKSQKTSLVFVQIQREEIESRIQGTLREENMWLKVAGAETMGGGASGGEQATRGLTLATTTHLRRRRPPHRNTSSAIGEF